MRRPSATIADVRLGVGYPGSTRIDHARRDFDAIASAGASVLVLGASEEEVLERPEHIATLVAAARERGLRVRVAPRGVLGLVGGGGVPFSIARDPSIRQRLTDGTDVPAACPNNPRTGERLERWLVLVLASKPDGIAWIEPRLWVPVRDPWNASRRDAWSCACDACVDAWALGRHDAPGGRMPGAFTTEVRAFRQRSLIGLLEPGLARAHRAGVENVLTVAPATGDDPEALPWADLLAFPYVHGLGTEPWTELDEAAVDHVAFWAARIAKAARGRAVTHVRIRLDGVRADRAGDLAEMVDAASEAGIDELLVRAWPEDVPLAPGDGSAAARPHLPGTDAWRLVADAVRASGPH